MEDASRMLRALSRQAGRLSDDAGPPNVDEILSIKESMLQVIESFLDPWIGNKKGGPNGM